MKKSERLKRYFLLFRIFMKSAGYPRAEFLKKKNYFKKIGEHCYLQPWNFGTEPALISMGNNVHIASKVTFITHDITSFMLKYAEPQSDFIGKKEGEIKIGNNVFIGANTTLLYDISIGNNVIIGAGSVVTKDIPDGVVAAGVPCKVIGTYDDFKERMKDKK